MAFEIARVHAEILARMPPAPECQAPYAIPSPTAWRSFNPPRGASRRSSFSDGDFSDASEEDDLAETAERVAMSMLSELPAGGLSRTSCSSSSDFSASSSSFTSPSCSQGSSPTSVLAGKGAQAWDLLYASETLAEKTGKRKPKKKQAQHQQQAARAAPPLATTSIAATQELSGTGVFLPKAGTPAKPANKKPVCPVLLPAHIVEALKLNVKGDEVYAAPRNATSSATMTFRVIDTKSRTARAKQARKTTGLMKSASF